MDLPSGKRIKNPDLTGYQVLHIADLLTRGSSIYSAPSGRKNPSGWLPAVRQRGAELKNLLVVVSRSQGGEELLVRQGLTTHSCMQIRYLTEKGIEILLPYTENEPKKLPRLEKFMGCYKNFLEDMGWLEILQQRGAHEAA